MSWIPGGAFLMGSEDFDPEERPVRRVEVDGFWMDRYRSRRAEFRRFVRETGYITVAKRPLAPDDYPDADPDLLVPGSLIFRKTAGPVPLDDVRSWWEYVPGAFWKKPGGPGTTINGRDRIRSCRSPTRMRRPTLPGRARSFRPRRSGSSPPAAASTEPPLRGGTSTSRTESRWRTPGRASFRGRT